jgi:hypothetical protein
MPYERPPMVVNMAFVIGAALCVALAAVWWVGADVMHRLDRVENWSTQIDGRLARIEARIEEVHAGPPAETDTVRMQQPAMLRTDGTGLLRRDGTLAGRGVGRDGDERRDEQAAREVHCCRRATSREQRGLQTRDVRGRA